MKLKVEINSREHFSVFGIEEHPFSVRSLWFSGETRIPGYTLDEQLGTKLRALYQRRKGRDLFDLAHALSLGGVDPERVVLYEAPPLPPRVWTLLDDDPGAKNLASEGTWEKDLKGKRVLFTFPGANGKPGLQRPLTVLLAKLSLFPGFKVEVVR